MNYKIIAVDFDGTLCENKWPEIGEAKTAVIKYLRKRQLNGDRLILWTCRIGKELDEAVLWCKDQGIIFDAINANLPEHIAFFGQDSRKIYADEYLDDHNLYLRNCDGCFGAANDDCQRCEEVFSV